MQIQLAPVHSTMISAVGYDKDSQTLRVQFKNGDAWDYSGVPPLTAQQMLTASSIGVFFGKVIKAKFTGVKVEVASDSPAGRNPQAPSRSLVVMGREVQQISIQLQREVVEALSEDLERASGIASVSDNAALDGAQKARSILKGWRIELTKDKDANKAPVRELGEKIEAAYRPQLEHIKAEEKRLEDLINIYAMKATEAARKEEDERRKLRVATDAAAAQASAKARELEAEAREAEVFGDTQGAAAAKAEASSLNLFAATADEAIPAPTVIAPRVKVKVKLGFRVIGRNEGEQQASLRKLAETYPHLVEISPRAGLINAALNSGLFKEPPPGLEIVEELKSSARSLPTERLLNA